MNTIRHAFHFLQRFFMLAGVYIIGESLFANTFPMFQKSLIPACIFGLAVSLAVTVAECFKKRELENNQRS